MCSRHLDKLKLILQGKKLCYKYERKFELIFDSRLLTCCVQSAVMSNRTIHVMLYISCPVQL